MPRPAPRRFVPTAPIAAGFATLILGLSAPIAAQQPTPDPIAAEAFVCFGNEPFWQMQVEGDAARWSAPGADGIVVGAPVGRFDRAEWGIPPTASWIGLMPPALVEGMPADADATAQIAALTIERRACADSMADTTHPLSAWLTHPVAGLVAGCCEPQRILTPDPADPAVDALWPAIAADLAPAIQACLDASDSHDRAVAGTLAEDGSGIVRLSNLRRERVDCAVDIAADATVPPTVTDLAAVGPDAPDLSGEGSAIAQSAATAIVGACHRATPIARTDGVAPPATDVAPDSLVMVRRVCADLPVVGE